MLEAGQPFSEEKAKKRVRARGQNFVGWTSSGGVCRTIT